MRWRYFYIVLGLFYCVESEAQAAFEQQIRLPGVQRLEIKSASNGYRQVYLFNDLGQPIQSSFYYKRKLLSKFSSTFNEKGMLSEYIQVFDAKKSRKAENVMFEYQFDDNGFMISKSEYWGKWVAQEYYSDYNEKGLPGIMIKVFNGSEWKHQLKYNEAGCLTERLVLQNDTISSIEYLECNEQGDIIFSSLPLLIDEEKECNFPLLLGGDRHSAIEQYEYTYDSSNRWIEMYNITEGSKRLLTIREFKQKK